LVTAVIEDVRRFIGEAEQADDVTVLAVRRAGSVARATGQ
jgi:serine phosphatase RsbU (regulator of sigma subunit)